MDPPLDMILQLPLRYSKGHIELSGLTKVLEEAETKRNDLIEKAVTISGGPKELDRKRGVLSEALRGSRYAASS